MILFPFFFLFLFGFFVWLFLLLQLKCVRKGQVHIISFLEQIVQPCGYLGEHQA